MSRKLATELVHFDAPESGGDPHLASMVPLYQSATFKQPSATQMGEYDYTRSGNPTRSQLERHMAKIMRARRCMAINSGMGAMDVIVRLLKPGDEVIAGDDLYGGTNRLLKYISDNGGVKVHHCDTTSVEAVSKLVSAKTTMLFLETPTNPLLKIADVPALSAAAKKANPDCIVVVDNTVMSPLYQRPLELGADIHYESGTKYLNGHHDVMCGIIAVNDPTLEVRLFHVVNATGSGLAPFDSWLLLRGVKTLAIRMERQAANAQKVAEWLESKGFKVNFPGLPSHPQYALHNKLATGAGAVLSFATGDLALSEHITSGCTLWGISVSFGCCDSLISMPCRMSHASIDPKVRKERNLPEDLIRLCVGIEDVDDLIDDLSNSIEAAKQAVAQGASAEGVNHPTAD
ncbi:cystathionine beta-lyase [Savitreella phatthalungensis]